MPELFPEIELRADQAEAFARGLITVAKADGEIHEREAALIADFYASTTNRAIDMGSLERAAPADGAYLAAALPAPEARELFLKTAVLLAFADGNYSAAESKVIAAFAAALGHTDLVQIETQVKEFLLGQLSHLKNTAAVAEVAKDLKF
jgi:tellurite resistance protein